MLVPPRKVFKRILNMALAGTRGGAARLEILIMIKNPCSIADISKKIMLNYKTVEYHMRVLEKVGLVSSSGKKYNNTYSHSSVLRLYYDVLEEAYGKLRKTK